MATDLMSDTAMLVVFDYSLPSHQAAEIVIDFVVETVQGSYLGSKAVENVAVEDKFDYSLAFVDDFAFDIELEVEIGIVAKMTIGFGNYCTSFFTLEILNQGLYFQNS